MKINKCGFSLIEVLVSVAVLAVLAVVLVPSLTSSRRDSNEKLDETAISSFETAMVMGLQSNSIYNEARILAERTEDSTMLIVCAPNDATGFSIKEMKIVDIEGTEFTNLSEGETGAKLAELQNELTGFINGSVEPIYMQSELYKNKEQHFKIKFPEVDFKVHVIEKLSVDK